MGCQSEVVIGENLTFTITTHDPDTGELTDAGPAAPAWRLYEGETAVPILTGTMAALDPVNTTGFYAETVACTAANGFEDDGSYNIYIEATVDGDTGGISYAFRAKAALTTSAAAAAASVSAGEVLIRRGDSMDQDITALGDVTTRTELWFTVKRQLDDSDADARILISEGTGLEVLNGEDVSATRAAEATITVTDAGAGDITVWMNPTATDELVPNATLHYDVQWTDGTEVSTPALDRARVSADVTRTVT